MTTDGPTDGWTVSPAAYLENRDQDAHGERLLSQYVTVRDGTRLAVDVHLPGTEDNGVNYPAILILTPYYRRFALRQGHRPDIEPCATIAFYRDMFVPRGYALVCVDVRGSGASFGCRDGFRSPIERLDHYDVADWVSNQPWCDGNIGATGISYPGAASDFLASTNHPSVKAVAPLFAVWDTWMNHLYPGGVLLNCVSQRYGQLAESLDLDKRELIPSYAYFKDDDLAGPAPVDEDPDGILLAQAIHQHHANFDMQDFAQQLRFRDSTLSENPDYSGADISPYTYANREADANTAYYSISGWMDGGGYSTGTIQRHLWLNNPDSRLMLGPWDHGARGHVSPWRKPDTQAQQPFVGAAVLRFFDKHLRGLNCGIDDEKTVHYYTMGEERWKSCDIWPPRSEELSFYPMDGNKLSRDTPAADCNADTYQGDFACRTGNHSRYDRLYIANVETYYDDWHGRDEAMLSYTTDPLGENTEMTGHPWIDLRFSCSEADCTFFVYISDITEKGKSLYVTEGIFRALHRKEGANPKDIPPTGPTHSYLKADANHLTPGEADEVRFELLPTSYLFQKGHRIRLSIALADSDHFTKIPAGRPPEITLFHDPDHPTRIVLPIINEAAKN
jgi:uncharacterized protein